MAIKTDAPPKPYLGFGTRIRKSPYFESTLKWGCKEYTTYNHMYFPVYYNTPEEDFWSLVNDVTLWDVAVERQLEIILARGFLFDPPTDIAFSGPGIFI